MKFDLHVHTIRGSDCSVLTPEELIERASQIGLDGVCITEHDTIWHSPELEDYARQRGLLLFFGLEANTDCGEVLIFGPQEYAEGFHRLSNLRRAVDGVGGIIIAAHPFRHVFSPFYANSGANELSVEQATQWPIMEMVDSLEVVNGASTKQEANFTCSVSTRLGLGMTGGSDAHSADGVGICVTVFERRITGWGEFLKELRAGRYRPEDLRTTLPPHL